METIINERLKWAQYYLTKAINCEDKNEIDTIKYLLIAQSQLNKICLKDLIKNGR